MAADPLDPNLLTPKIPPPPTPYGSTSVADRVTDIAGKDSALNQMARTEGLKVAGRRGLLNSTMAVGAAQDAVLRQAVPIASQDASQAFQGSEAALGRDFQASESALGRTSQEGMQQKDIASQQLMQEKSLTSAEQAQIRDIKFREGDAAANRAQDLLMQQKSLTATEQAQIRDIRSREGDAAANRQQALLLQQKDIANTQSLQNKDIAFKTGQGALDRTLQQKIANWNLSSTDRAAAAQMVTNLDSLYSSDIASINGNTSMSAAARTVALKAAAALRLKRLNLAEQIYSINLTF